MNWDRLVRELAKTTKYQVLYSNFKEGSLSFFANSYDYSPYQILFLHYLSFFNEIYQDIALEEVGPEVMKHRIFEDSYMAYKRKKSVKDLKRTDPSDIQSTNKKSNKPGFSWVFRNKPGKAK